MKRNFKQQKKVRNEKMVTYLPTVLFMMLMVTILLIPLSWGISFCWNWFSEQIKLEYTIDFWSVFICLCPISLFAVLILSLTPESQNEYSGKLFEHDQDISYVEDIAGEDYW